MYSKDVIILRNYPLRKKPDVSFIQKTNSYQSSIRIQNEERSVNAKSLLAVLSMGLCAGMKVTLIAEGADEQEAVETIAEWMQNGGADPNLYP